MTERIVTDALGFPLKVAIVVRDLGQAAGRHVTYETPEGLVQPDAEHRIELDPSLEPGALIDACSHEAYHLFYSVRHLITADEETQAEVFGHLVRRLYAEVAI
jgi:hypothetical protein